MRNAAYPFVHHTNRIAPITTVATKLPSSLLLVLKAPTLGGSGGYVKGGRGGGDGGDGDVGKGGGEGN